MKVIHTTRRIRNQILRNVSNAERGKSSRAGNVTQ